MKGNRMEQAKKYWWIVCVVFAVGAWVTFVEMGLGAEKEKNSKQDEAIARLIDNQQKLAEISKAINGKIDVILQLIGVKVSDSLISCWKVMPREVPVDAEGKHLPNKEWLSISDDYLYARTFRWIKDDSILVKVEWDKRK